jgi:hypothetical protein
MFVKIFFPKQIVGEQDVNYIYILIIFVMGVYDKKMFEHR